VAPACGPAAHVHVASGPKVVPKLEECPLAAPSHGADGPHHPAPSEDAGVALPGIEHFQVGL
jgi:hypothetical protein